MNILFFGAHPDDVEILCGGTIRRCVASGHQVWIAVATNGNVGSPDLSCPEISHIRHKEAAAATDKLGASGLIWMNEDDEFLFDNKPTRLKFVDAIRQAQADIIVTHNPHDYHPDHVACSKLASDARILSAVRLIQTAHPHLSRSPELFYMDSLAGINFTPQYYVDITETFEDKVGAISCHTSQNSWLKSIFDQGLLSIARVQSEFRGLQIGRPYAEAFLQPEYWPKSGVTLPFLKSSERGLH